MSRRNWTNICRYSMVYDNLTCFNVRRFCEPNFSVFFNTRAFKERPTWLDCFSFRIYFFIFIYITTLIRYDLWAVLIHIRSPKALQICSMIMPLQLLWRTKQKSLKRWSLLKWIPKNCHSSSIGHQMFFCFQKDFQRTFIPMTRSEQQL